MGPRWKGKGAERKALADPMAMIVYQLQSPLIQSNAGRSPLDVLCFLQSMQKRLNFSLVHVLEDPLLQLRRVINGFNWVLRKHFSRAVV